MKFVIEGREYPQAQRGRLKLAVLDRAETELGIPFGEIEALPTNGIRGLCIALWIARLAAGEDISFEDSKDVDVADIEVIVEPGDEEQVPGPDPLAAPTASARGGVRQPADHRKKASKRPSTGA